MSGSCRKGVVLRQRRMPFVVKHRVDLQPTRYEVDHRHEQALVDELEVGRAVLSRWLAKGGA